MIFMVRRASDVVFSGWDDCAMTDPAEALEELRHRLAPKE
jgi:hypothetical protein